MERFVHRLHAPRRAGESGDKGFRGLPAALEARTVAGGERGRLVEEKELRVISDPDVAAPSLEFADADEPVVGLPSAAAQRPVVAMQPPAAIAHHAAALGDGVQFAERIDAILQRPGSLRHAGRRLIAYRERQVHASRPWRLWGRGHGARTSAELRILRSGSRARFA